MDSFTLLRNNIRLSIVIGASIIKDFKKNSRNAKPNKNFLTAFKVRGIYIYKINYRRHNGFSLKKNLSEIICYYLNQKD